MDDNKKIYRGGKKEEPTSEELEFIYNHMNKLTNSEILEEMQGEEFPVRSKGFMKRRRKEFSAVKKSVEAQVKREFDPIIIECRRQHWDDLLNVAKKIEGIWKKYIDYGQKVQSSYIIDDPEFDLFTSEYGYMAKQLLQHLKAEFPMEFEKVTIWSTLLSTSIPDRCVHRIVQVAARRTFEGTCEICQGWQLK